MIFSVCFCDRGRGRDWKRMDSESMINRWEIEWEDIFDSKSSEAGSESSLQSARTAHSVLVSRDRDAPAAAHCVKKLFRSESATDTVGLSVPRAQGMRSMAKEVSAITQAPREVCRSGHCVQPSIYQLAGATAVNRDPATAAGGAAAAAAGAGGPGAAGAAAAEGKSK